MKATVHGKAFGKDWYGSKYKVEEWLILISSSIIIALGLTLIIAIQLLALKTSSIIT